MGPWHYQPARDLDQPMIERLRRFPREPDMLVYGLRLVTTLFCRGWLRSFHRLSILGRENLPAEGSFVMVANHASHLDVLCLLAALPLARIHRAFPAAARDYFFESTPLTFLATVAVNAMPFDRRSSPRQSLGFCHRVLETPGNALILFPEGTRSTSCAAGEFKPGIGLLVAGTNYPVVPCYIEGAHRAWPKGAWLPRPGKVRVRIGPPQQFSQHGRGKDSALRIAGALREAVLSLSRAPDHPSSGLQPTGPA
jgi:1-acyl-sn-glycerol-3-phosphate acyltransferase